MKPRWVAGSVRQLACLVRVDIGDPRSIALLRARVLMVAALGGAVADVAGGLGNGLLSGAHVIDVLASLAFVLCLGGYAWWRGPRLGDAAYAAAVFMAYPVAAVGVHHMTTAMVPMAVVCGLPATVLAVLFVERTRTVWIGLAICLTSITVLATTGSWRGELVTQYVVAVFAMVVTVIPMRWVRDVAVGAVVRSRRAEATDALTGLLNRRGLERSGAAIWQRAASAGVPLTALILDLDHFKQINDRHGHAEGDEVLRRLGGLLATRTRGDDVVARMGGEEFLVLSLCWPDRVEVFAERLRRTVEAELAPITVSIGVHTDQPTVGEGWPEACWAMVDVADRALYRAKAEGRNRVVIHRDGQRPETDGQRPGAGDDGSPVPAQRDAPPSWSTSGRPSARPRDARRREDGDAEQGVSPAPAPAVHR